LCNVKLVGIEGFSLAVGAVLGDAFEKAFVETALTNKFDENKQTQTSCKEKNLPTDGLEPVNPPTSLLKGIEFFSQPSFEDE
jgi:hypothetical protein